MATTNTIEIKSSTWKPSTLKRSPLKAVNTEKVEQKTEQPNAFLGASSIHAMAHWAPETRKSAATVEAEITANLPAPLDIEERLGMREKRVCPADMSITDMAVAAAEQLIQNKTFYGEDIDINDVDLVIYFSVARECAEPATAVFIQNRLGIDRAMAFDVSDACIGFSDAWCIADGMIATGRVRKALLVSAERISGISDSAADQINKGEHPRDHYAALSLGDGACAILLGAKRSHTIEMVSGCRESYSQYSDFCILPALDEPMLTKAGRMFNVALSKFPALVNAVVEKSKWTIDDVDLYITHQASLPSIKKGANILNVPFEKTYNTIEEFGNMASVSAPFSLSKAISEQKEWRKQKILMVTFGSGLGVGVFTLQCC